MNQPKLTINHIAPYLPYNLKFKTDKGIWVLETLDKAGWIVTGRKAMYCEQISFLVIKPILRPLPDLTDAEWISVFEAGLSQSSPPVVIEIDSFELSEYGAELLFKEGKDLLSLDYCFDEKSFSTNGIRFNQLAAFSELFKLHGDLFDLIGQLLAVKEGEA